MRRRLVTSFVGVTAVVLILVAIPMGYLLQRVATDEVRSQLSDQASNVLARATAAAQSGGSVDLVDLERLLLSDTSAEIRFDDGTVHRLNKPIEGTIISATVSGEGNTTVTTSTSMNSVRERVQQPLIILGLLGVAGLMATWLLAQTEARRLDGPISDLARTAERLGSGDFSVVAPRSGIPELDSLASTLDTTAARIDALVSAERSFTSDAGHQLRSALTGLRLRIEELTTIDDPDMRDEASAALEQVDRLSGTVDDLLRLSRTGRAGVTSRFDLRPFIRAHVDDVLITLRSTRRTIRFDDGAPLVVAAAPGAIGQALDVLLWNAVRHGQGIIRVSAEVDKTWAIVRVADEGSVDPESVGGFFTPSERSGSHGIGLPLARRVVEAEGGRLDLVSHQPTTFQIRLPMSVASADH